MVNTPKTYPPDSEVAKLISELLAAGQELRVTVGYETYVLTLTADAGSRPDPDTVARTLAGIEQAAGSWKDEDTDAFLDYVYRRRSLPPRPAVKL